MLSYSYKILLLSNNNIPNKIILVLLFQLHLEVQLNLYANMANSLAIFHTCHKYKLGMS